MEQLETIVNRLKARNSERTEADIQSDLKHLLLSAPLNLLDQNLEVRLESQAGSLRRIDVEVGSTVFEVKKDLRVGNIRVEALKQLSAYVQARQQKFDCRYVGVLTDGAEWICYHLVAGALHEVSRFAVGAEKASPMSLIDWLEGVLATTHHVKPLPDVVQQRLGAQSSAHQLDRATLAILFDANRNLPVVKTKRLLWSKLLSTALGTQFEDSDELFVEHTLLVNSAEIIAHAVLGFDIQKLSARVLLGGEQFEEAQVYGVIERDFFDWACEVEGGPAFIRSLTRRLSRFDWSSVEHDVLKILYESVITAEMRKKLGEYYTPDWLAYKVVEQVMTNPLEQRVLDPSCGSGTFLFHAIRRWLDAAKAQKWQMKDTLEQLTRSVIGMDLHPVAATLARVTYLLAIGRKRLSQPRGTLHIPVYLGDSVQWLKQEKNLLNDHELVIEADDNRELVPQEFRFPLGLLQDPQRFDSLVTQMANVSITPGNRRVSGIFDTHAIRKEHRDVLEATFKVMCRLHDEGRDHIWGYYIRNLARPEWLAQEANQVDTLIGNPPWLAYRHMPPDMQLAFREMSMARGLWHGAKVATHQDLSALFVARAVELYLKKNGRFGFVMPSAVIDAERQHYKGFRSGQLSHRAQVLCVHFEQPWDLKRLRPHFFPITASVVFGSRNDAPGAMPQAETWTGRLSNPQGAWSDVKDDIEHIVESKAKPLGEGSPYAERFRQGATIVPRVLFMVERRKAGPLGHAQGRLAVRSLRSSNEKAPWKDTPDREGIVESVFVRPVYTGESVLPYRTRPPLHGIIPRDKNGLMDGTTERLDHYPELAKWWRSAEETWVQHRRSDRLTLIEQLNYHNKLNAQFPIAWVRVLYSSSGMHLSAAYIEDMRGVIDNSLYWAAAASVDEALYLCAVMNAAITTQVIRPMMSFGKDERHIHKTIWKLPIPYYQPEDEQHLRLAELARELKAVIDQFNLPDELHFAAARRRVRELIEGHSVGREIEALVKVLLGC